MGCSLRVTSVSLKELEGSPRANKERLQSYHCENSELARFQVLMAVSIKKASSGTLYP